MTLAGDLKPENLLLADNNDNSVLKIADFGTCNFHPLLPVVKVIWILHEPAH